MKAQTASAAGGDTLALNLLGGAAILLGIVREATSFRPARVLADVVAAHPALHPGLLLLACGIASISWNLGAPWRRAAAPPARQDHATDIPEAPPAETNSLQGSPARERLFTSIAAAASGERPAAVLVIDIDGFRALRRAHGNDSAANLLCQFGERVTSLAPCGAVFARVAGDEFVLLLPDTDAAAASHVAANVQVYLSGPFDVLGGVIDVAASVGIAMAPTHGTSTEELLRAARLAVSLAKSGGGRDCRMFDAALCQAAQDRSSLRAELRPALEAGQFVPYYQPIICLRTGDIVGMEVLARWHHPQRGVIGPDQFIPMMETQRLCGDLSRSLLRQVIADASCWPRCWTFAFNASACQLPDLLTFIADSNCYPGGAMDPRRIEIEVTETVLIEDMALARRAVQALHRAGAKVVLDDFGTGYANLLPLRDLPFDRIKIDRGFVRDMLISARTNACLFAMLNLARSLGATVVAEGVECEAMQQGLFDMGCEFAQGYYYSPPVPAEGVPLLAKRTEMRAQSRAVAA